MAFTRNQNSVPATAMIATRTSIAATFVGGDEAERGGDERERRAASACRGPPSTGPPHPPGDHAQEARHEQAARERAGAVVVVDRAVPAGDHGDQVGGSEQPAPRSRRP